MPYTHLFFDADGTLFDFEAAQAYTLKHTFEQFNHLYQPNYLEAYHRINEHLWSEFEHGRLTQAQVVIQRFEQLFSWIHCSLEPKVFNEAYLKNLASNNQLLPGASELVKTLYGRFHMLILTNGVASVQRKRFANSSLAIFFDDIIISEEIGATKPHQMIFAAAFDKIKNPPKSQVLMVGDSLSADIYGANLFGIDACWFNPHRLPRPSEFVIRFEITTLNELGGILE